jgi:hypothetical protein
VLYVVVNAPVLVLAPGKAFVPIWDQYFDLKNTFEKNWRKDWRCHIKYFNIVYSKIDSNFLIENWRKS